MTGAIAATGAAYAMVAVHGPSVEAASSLAAQVGAYLAIVNGPAEAVVAGESASLDRLTATCEARGIHVRRLAVPIPSHTPLLAPAAVTFWRDIVATPFPPLDLPVVSGVTGAVITSPDDVRASLRYQIDHPINWARSIESRRRDGHHPGPLHRPGPELRRLVAGAPPPPAGPRRRGLRHSRRGPPNGFAPTSNDECFGAVVSMSQARPLTPVGARFRGDGRAWRGVGGVGNRAGAGRGVAA